MKIAILFLFLAISAEIFAQNNTNIKEQSKSDDSPKNAIYISAGSILFYNTIGLNYSRRIWKTDKGFFKNYYLNFESGFFKLYSWSGNSKGFLNGISVVGLTGKHNKHFETGLGFTLNVETENNFEDEKERTTIVPEVAFGYRYQKIDDVFFRAGIGFPRLLYIGLGYSF